MLDKTRNYRNLSAREKDSVIEQLLDLLNMEVYDPDEWGTSGAELRKKSTEEEES